MRVRLILALMLSLENASFAVAQSTSSVRAHAVHSVPAGVTAAGVALPENIPDFSQDQPGYGLAGVTKDGPAERAGIRAGDIVVQFGDSKIGNLEDFDSALRKYKAGDRVPLALLSGDMVPVVLIWLLVMKRVLRVCRRRSRGCD